MAQRNPLQRLLNNGQISRGMVWGLLIISALLAFEIFNYSTTDFAMSDLLGDLRFLGVRWATILAIAFCGIDFAGIARLFTPETGDDEPKEVWYLFGAWLLAAAMNAMLTWWGVSIAIANNTTLGSAVIDRETLLTIVPIFVAVMVWLIRVLIIGTFSVAGERLFSEKYKAPARRRTSTVKRPATARRSTAASFKPNTRKSYSKAEPTYHPVSMQSRSSSQQTRQ
ncbi:MAG: hypothetical protein DWQ07_25430 [Chloroflexi bacterium]|nr:MAG: hypothetical protein DWQ07_25430 [Chloroflexota bacterium]MBL1196121.1 hypothetical protein [Chloroflexota bacterium]NOH13414.1 hypothetical protein [Chloroflexota bacterium]